jgi:hypothetical protein
MALQRTDSTLVQPVIAQFDDIKSFNVDVFKNIINIVVAHGNYNNGKFEELSCEVIKISGQEFGAMAYTKADMHDTIFGNLKGLLWNALLVRGIVQGEIV